ncbi:polysaccharide biosynthesis C-terminal domain-containing protein [Bacterioplanoides sp.]|uniref:polysaccharide biosynthesis C-terminal domain-containing protein n=1 Tax=Bacterioplanoides sp. TaxID=2066072 RepID=UPI003B004D46
MISRKMILGGIKTLGLKVFNLAAMFAVSVLLARVLGVDEYGNYVFVFTLVGLLSEPYFIGLRTLAVRHTALNMEPGSHGLVRGLFVRLCQVSLVGAAVAFLVLLIVALVMGDDLGEQGLFLCLAGACLPVFLGINRVRDGVLRGAGYLVEGQIPKLLLRPLFLLIYIFLAWWIFAQEFSATLAILMQVCAALTAMFVYRYIVNRKVFSALADVAPQYQTRNWLRELLPLMLTAGLMVADTRVGILILGVIEDTAEASKLHAALRVAELITLAHAVANLIIEPMIARHYDKQEMALLQKKMTLVAGLILLSTLPVSLIMMLHGEWILSVFGEEFRSVAPVLTILAVAHLIDASMGAVTQTLSMTGNAGEAVKGMLLGLVINIVLCVVLIPQQGAIGAAWAVLLSTLVYKVYLVIRIYRLTGIWTTPLYLLFQLPARFR